MAATAMLDSCYQAIIIIIDVLFFIVATFPPSLVKTGQEIRGRHQFLEIQDGGHRHVGVRLPGISRYHRHVAMRSCNIPTKFGENWSEN